MLAQVCDTIGISWPPDSLKLSSAMHHSLSTRSSHRGIERSTLHDALHFSFVDHVDTNEAQRYNERAYTVSTLIHNSQLNIE